MSLINDMLKDLEKRPHLALAADNPIAGLRTNLFNDYHPQRKYYFALGVLLFVLLLSTLLLWPNHRNDIAKPHVEEATTATPLPIETTAPVTPAEPILLTGINLQTQQGIAYLHFLLSQNPLYQISSNDMEHEIILIFENTHLLAPLPRINYTGTGIADIQTFVEGKDDLKVVLHLNPGADIKRLELGMEGKAPELQMDVSYHNTTPTKTTTPIVAVKKPIPESTLEQRYQYSLHLSESGQISAAIESLTLLLNEFPSYTEARESLVALLVQQDQKAVALKVLDTGLALEPNYSDFIKLKARILLEQGKLNAALAVLEAKAPPMLSDPEYHALRAALYQQKGQNELASELYKQLLAIQPSNAKWWVGLGVALEANGNRSQAIEAFTNADSIGGLSPELKAYLDSRLNAL